MAKKDLYAGLPPEEAPAYTIREVAYFLGIPRTVVINPRIAFGRPVLVGTRIPTAVIAERVAARESLEEIAADYDRTTEEILEAIRWELHAPAA